MLTLSTTGRHFAAFISYSHADSAVAWRLSDWLTDLAGLEIYIDLKMGPERIDSHVSRRIGQSRAMILLLSKASAESRWVKFEYDQAIKEQASDPSFHLITLKLDDVEVPDYLSQTKWFALPDKALSLEASGQLLCGLYPEQDTVDIDHARDIYVCRSWRFRQAQDRQFADSLCNRVAGTGFRLVGDATDQGAFDPTERIPSIMRSCGAVLAVLPHREDNEFGTSPYILDELETARKIGLPYIVAADPGVDPTQSRISALVEGAVGQRLYSCRADLEIDQSVAEPASQLNVVWSKPKQSHYCFFATSFNHDLRWKRWGARVIEQVTGMRCFFRQDPDFLEMQYNQSAQSAVAQRVSGAQFVLADISPAGDKHLDSLLEIGLARASHNRIHVFSRDAAGEAPRLNADPANIFMLRDLDYNAYRDEIELIAKVHKVARKYRRRIFNWELARTL